MKKVHFYREDFENMSKEELQEKLNGLIEAGLVSPDTTLDDVGIWDTPEYCLRKLIISMYGREDYLADAVEAIPATDRQPEQPEGLALPVQNNHKSKMFDKAVERVVLLMKDLAAKQYMERIGVSK